MSDRATTETIQQDWKEREMIEVVHLNILKVRGELSSTYTFFQEVSIVGCIARPPVPNNVFWLPSMRK